jgi:hypothetical protein
MIRQRHYVVPALLMLLVFVASGKLVLTRVAISEAAGSEFTAFDEFVRGWPWAFEGTRESYDRSTPTIRQSETLFFSTAFLTADVTVLMIACGAFACSLGWLWVRTGGGRQFSLRGLMLLTAIVAAVLGWWTHERAQWKREQRVISALPQQGINCRSTAYCGPEWLRRFWPADDLVIFHRVVEVRDDDAYWPDRSPERCARALAAALAQLTSVRRAVLHSQVAAHLTDPAACALVEEVYLWDRGDADGALLALSRRPNLRVLTIDVREQESDISDRGLAHLARCHQLEDLYIPAGDLPNVTDEGIAQLAAAKRLRRLTLPNVPITDAAMASVVEMPALESLSIYLCPNITDHGVRRLLESPTLKSVVVADSPKISDETIRLLRQRLQRVTVVGPSGTR